MDCFQTELSRDDLREILKERKHLLERMLADLSAERKGVPPGQIRVSRKKGSFQYYYKKEPGERWRYLPKYQRSLAVQVINRSYHDELATLASNELRLINKFLLCGYPMSIDAAYQKLSSGRKAVIKHRVPSNADAINDFYSFTYEPLCIFEENRQYETARGELVRSKAEWMIAQMLHEFGVPYQYEAPLILREIGTVRPDFRCFNVRRRKVVYWEHFGKMGSNDYASVAIRKIRNYAESGYHLADNFIMTEESGESPLTPGDVEYWIRRVLI
ncbi:MAG: hypothetical protein IKX54_05760 [Lachnospiraceae bacterium]|nr:hypothetical protein [Lachnospiraceae bacterium]